MSVSIPSNGSIQFLHNWGLAIRWLSRKVLSQSPQTGQFNSYLEHIEMPEAPNILSLNPLKRVNSILTLDDKDYVSLLCPVSIPSNGSIQFLPILLELWSLENRYNVSIPSNGSIQFLHSWNWKDQGGGYRSQSPQTGQFNSYYSITQCKKKRGLQVSIPSNGSIQFLQNSISSEAIKFTRLNPLKRVNSILTGNQLFTFPKRELKVSIPSNGSIQFLRILRKRILWNIFLYVSIPSNGSIQFLQRPRLKPFPY